MIVGHVRAKMKELNIKDKKDIGSPRNRSGEAGKLTGAVMKELKGQADGTVVKNIIEGLLQ